MPAATSSHGRIRGHHHERAALTALEASALHHLASARQVYVAFSGGRDSSAVLAVVATVARREGLPAPVALTQVWPRLPSTDESRWQSEVLSLFPEVVHERLPVIHEHELLGPTAQSELVRRGVVWPPTAHGAAPLLAAARGGTLLDGEGGDELFGPTRLRILRHVRYARPSLPLADQVASAVLPRPARTALAARGLRRAWLHRRPGRRTALALAREVAHTPASAAREILTVPHRRARTLGSALLEREARRWDVERCSPLLESDPVQAVAAQSGALGWKSRTEAMTAVFGEVLPGPVLARTSKADFSRAVWGPETKRWLVSWDRVSGVDPSLVDSAALAREWAAPVPHAASALLAQSAWLAQETGLPPLRSDTSEGPLSQGLVP